MDNFLFSEITLNLATTIVSVHDKLTDLLLTFVFDEINVCAVLESQGNKSVHEGLFKDIEDCEL